MSDSVERIPRVIRGSNKVSGNHQPDPATQGVPMPEVITGQVCVKHRTIQHTDNKPPWCHYCGKDDDGNQQGRPNGGWT